MNKAVEAREFKPGDYVSTPHNSSSFKIAEVRNFKGNQAVRFENGTQWYDATDMVLTATPPKPPRYGK